MLEQELDNFKCPKCGGRMEKGYITGQYSRLRWCTTGKTVTIFEGKPLMKKRNWFHAPTVPASRCRNCRFGVFVYDKD